MNLQARAAVIERLLDELGQPEVTAVTLYPEDEYPGAPASTALQLREPPPDLKGDETEHGNGTNWSVEIVREELRIRVVCWMPKAAA